MTKIHTTEETLTKGLWNHWVFLSIIILLTFFAYSNVLHGELQFDDEQYLFEDPLLQSPHAFKSLNFWNAFKSGVRPVTAFTFALNYYFWGKDTFSYHLTNLLIHISNGIMVYVFIYITLKTPFLKKKYDNNAHWIAFLTSLLFSIHPIQTQAVSYIYQRAESLSSLFFLASLIAFIAAAKSEGVKKIFYSILFIIGFVIALGSKEVPVILPIISFIYGTYFFEKKDLWKKLVAPWFLIFAGLIIATFRLMSLGENPSAGYYLKDFTAWEYLLTQFSVIVTYLRLLILPIGQSLDHIYPISKGFWEAKTFMSFTFLILLLSLAVMIYTRWRPGSFFILWFFITLSPSSSILPLKDILVEHRLYLPSLGIFFIFASGMVKVSDILKGRLDRKRFIAIYFSIFISIVSVLWIAAYNRNYIWKSRLAMWEDAAKKCSMKSSRIHNNLGNCYMLLGRHFDAIEEYKKAIALDKNNIEAYYNLGINLENVGRLNQAVYYYDIFCRTAPEKYNEQKKTVCKR